MSHRSSQTADRPDGQTASLRNAVTGIGTARPARRHRPITQALAPRRGRVRRLAPAWLIPLILGLSAPAAAQVAGPTGTAPAPFSTALGLFTPQPWTELPGWPEEAHAEALSVFRQTCRGLQRRETWRATCASAQSSPDGTGAARTFFEALFVPYRVTPRDATKDGLMTGYFEPVLDGSPTRRKSFVVPVYGAPSDLLLLDARRWQAVPMDGTVRARIVAEQVLPAGAGETGLALDPAIFDSEPLDRRFRVRLDGDRIVPYWTRQQIEAGIGLQAPVIAWVDDPQALYLMQVQGSGQIRMPDGRTIRVSYSEQNGHPFRPRGGPVAGTRTRSIGGSSVDEPAIVVTPVSLRTQSLIESRSLDESVNQIVDALLAQPPQPGQPPQAGQSPRRAGQGGGTAVGDAPGGVKARGAKAGAGLPGRDADARTSMNLSHLVSARANDPSYVFFQPAPTGGSGPVGALGVPLTATRSIAVDPRSTPLGAPVFIEAERGEAGEPMRRLMIAQDTGGAIRGAVRADSYWGTGPRAGAQAMRTKDTLAMWVLLPRDFTPPRAQPTRTRAIGSPGGESLAAECVMPDSDYCLD